MRSDLGKSVLSSVVIDWQFPSVPWTFIIDANGVVIARFEGFARISEVEEALQELIA